MDFLFQLWIPIIISAVAVFFASFLFWAVLPFHRKDHNRLPDEEGFAQAVRNLNIPPGKYFFPFTENRAQEKDPEYLKRMKEGPTGVLSLWGNVSMGRNMALTFLANLLVSIIIAYLAWTALDPGDGFMDVFRVIGTAGVLAYAFAFISHDVWFAAYGRTILLKMFDGVIYGLVTGIIFAAFWPSA